MELLKKVLLFFVYILLLMVVAGTGIGGAIYYFTDFTDWNILFGLVASAVTGYGVYRIARAAYVKLT